MQTIQRDSPTPYYEQLYEILRDRILRGDYPVDERLPSELELGRDFNLSRTTVRQTLSKLESEGLARKVARRGFFVSEPEKSTTWTVQGAEGFLESQMRHGETGVKTTVVSADTIRPPKHVAQALELESDVEVFALERIRWLNDQLVLFSTNWLPRDVGGAVSDAKDVLDGTGSLNAVLRQAGFIMTGAQRVIHALSAPEKVAKHLEIPSGWPILRIRSCAWDRNNRRFDYYETWVLTDVVPLEINVTAS